MRRTLLLTASIAVLVAVAAVALASGGPTAETKGATLKPEPVDAHVPTSGPFAVAAQSEADPPADDRPSGDRQQLNRTLDRLRRRQLERRASADRVHDRITTALAQRLDVAPDRMRLAFAETKARMLSRFVDRGVIGAGERLTLESCLNEARCDPTLIRPVIRKLRADLSRTDSFADRKEELLHALSRSLDLDEDRIEDALHTQLDVSLSFAEQFGALDDRARRMAVACFDTPTSCDAEALQDVFSAVHGRDEQ